MKWVDKEEGPSCYCGMPTVVVVENGEANLLCIFHTQSAGALFPLPEERPDNWPNLNDDELDQVMLKGQEELDAKESKNEKDEPSLPSGTLN